jgi:hypothetical protein
MRSQTTMDAIKVVAQGRVFEIVDMRQKQHVDKQSYGTAKRGNIRVMSRKSRNRLIDLFARIDGRGCQIKFVTLTFGGTPTHQEAYACLRRFLERLRRKHPEVALVWRKELQDRGAIHYHLLIYHMPYYPQRALQRVWTDVTGENLSIVDIRAVYNDAMASRYVSKYIAKVDDREASSLEDVPYLHADENQSSGRWWGVHNAANLPMATRLEFRITGRDHTRYIAWWIERMIPGFYANPNLSRKLYTNESRQAYIWAYHIEKPLNPPFVKEHHHERAYLDRQRTVTVPLQPKTPVKRDYNPVGESGVRDHMDAGRSKIAVLLSTLSAS